MIPPWSQRAVLDKLREKSKPRCEGFVALHTYVDGWLELWYPVTPDSHNSPAGYGWQGFSRSVE
jgi:hypothetical protein